MSITSDQMDTPLRSGNAEIDSLIFDAQGINWNMKVGDEGNLVKFCYSLASGANGFYQPISVFSEEQRSHTNSALSYIDSFTGLVHQETKNPAEADLFFYNANLGDNTLGLIESSFERTVNARTGDVGESSIKSFIYMGTGPELVSGGYAPGSLWYETMLHELGHALGLGHPHEDLIISSGLDNTAVTLMSYEIKGGPYSYFQPLDVQAIHFIYGGDGISGQFGAYSQTPAKESNPYPSYLIYSGLDRFYPDAVAAAIESQNISFSTTSSSTSQNTFRNEVFSATSANATFSINSLNYDDVTVLRSGNNSDTWSISSTTIGTDSLVNYSRILFKNGILAIDIDQGETAGQCYRLYQAAFARTPDIPGVAFHINDMETNGLSITQIAGNFIASPEFKSMYGNNPTEQEYIQLLYQNVLGRSPAEFEVDFYKNRFEQGISDRQITLVNFSESPENVNLVNPQIEIGIFLENFL